MVPKGGTAAKKVLHGWYLVCHTGSASLRLCHWGSPIPTAHSLYPIQRDLSNCGDANRFGLSVGLRISADTGGPAVFTYVAEPQVKPQPRRLAVPLLAYPAFHGVLHTVVLG